MTDNLLRPAGIAWGHLGRWFLRGRVFRIAIQVRMLTLASLGVLLTIFGWWLIAQMFMPSVPENPDLSNPVVRANESFKEFLSGYESCPWTADERVSSLPAPFAAPSSSDPALGAPPSDAIVDPWHRLSAPVFQLFDLSRTWKGALFLTFCIFWAAVIWGLFGGALTRSAVVQLSREEPATLGAALGHALRRWPAYFAAPLLPLTAVMLVTFGLLFLGLVMRASVFVAALGWPIALLGGIVMALTATGLTVGWPLMHATISAEGSDGFDAISRSYSYVYQRPLHYLFYGLIAALLGLLGLAVVNFFAAAVWHLTAWSVSWGSGQALMENVLLQSNKLEGSDKWGAGLIHFWHGCVKLFVVGYAFAFFWTAVSAVYLLLRYDADGAELDEVFFEDSGPTYGLPPLAKDSAGVPIVPKEEPPPTSG